MIELNDRIINLGYFSDICTSCKNYNKNSTNAENDIIGTCKAFPKEIPEEIWTGENNHTKSYKGDNGIQFEPTKEK